MIFAEDRERMAGHGNRAEGRRGPGAMEVYPQGEFPEPA